MCCPDVEGASLVRVVTMRGVLARVARSARAQRGLSDSLQWAVLTPLVLGVVFALLHMALVLRAATIVQDAAVAGAHAAAVAPDGQQRAAMQHAVDQVTGGGELQQTTAEFEQVDTMVRVQVHGRANALLGFGPRDVSAEVVVPDEP